MDKNQEKRLIEHAELTDNSIEEKKVITGYALKFDEPSKDLGGFVEVITRDALQGVDLSDVYLLYGHDYKQPLASTKAGTLQLRADEVGLHFEAELPETSYARDVYENVAKKLLDSMSFGFVMGENSYSRQEDGSVVRSIEGIKKIREISVVTVPAYDSTNVQIDTRSYEAFINKNQTGGNAKKETDNMGKVLIDNEQTETRSFEYYIRSQGEVRDGLTTQNASVVIPKEVIGEVFDLKRSRYNLAQYATVKQVSNGQGKYPVATNQQAILGTKAELAEIDDVEADMFKQVEYKVETRAGKIALSNEVIEDSVVNIIAEVKSQLAKMVENTDNKHIIDLLKTFTKKKATNLDDLKEVFNVDLDPALNVRVITNQSGYNHLDTLKDKDGRYLLQPDVTAPSGKSLFGAPVIVISNKLLPDDGGFPLFIGDIAQAIFVARRNQVTTQWEKFDYYSQGLAVIVRNDYQVIDKEALMYVTLQESTPTPKPDDKKE